MIKKIFKILGLLMLILAIAIFGFSIYLSRFYTVPILMYHSLNKDRVKNYSALDPEKFKQQMKFIYQHHYKVIPLEDYVKALKNKQPIDKKSVVITFDDGEKDNLELWPIIKAYDFPITIFLIVDKIDQPGFLSREDIKYFLNNSHVNFGSHTLTHPYLPDIPLEKLKEEIFGSKKKLSEILGREINTICYPIGGFDERVLKEVKQAGYIAGCTTNRGFSSTLDPLSLRRIKVTNKDGAFSLWIKLSGFYNYFKKIKKPY